MRNYNVKRANASRSSSYTGVYKLGEMAEQSLI